MLPNKSTFFLLGSYWSVCGRLAQEVRMFDVVCFWMFDACRAQEHPIRIRAGQLGWARLWTCWLLRSLRTNLHFSTSENSQFWSDLHIFFGECCDILFCHLVVYSLGAQDKCWSNACSSWLQQRGFGKKISQRGVAQGFVMFVFHFWKIDVICAKAPGQVAVCCSQCQQVWPEKNLVCQAT